MVETREGRDHPQPETGRVRFGKCIVVLVGIPLTGKTTLGQELASRSNLTLLDVNVARLEISPRIERLPNNLHEQYITLTAYQKNHERARDLLCMNQPVILEATYSREVYHKMLRGLAETTESPLRVFFLDAPPDEEIAERARKRQEEDLPTTVVKTAAVALDIKRRYQLITGVDLVRLDPNQPLEEKVKEVLKYLVDLRSS